MSLYQELCLQVRTKQKLSIFKHNWVSLFLWHQVLVGSMAKTWRLQGIWSQSGIWSEQTLFLVYWPHFQSVLYFPLVPPIVDSRQVRIILNTRNQKHRTKWLRPHLLTPKQVPNKYRYFQLVMLSACANASVLSNLETVLHHGKLLPSFYMLFLQPHLLIIFFSFFHETILSLLKEDSLMQENKQMTPGLYFCPQERCWRHSFPRL